MFLLPIRVTKTIASTYAWTDVNLFGDLPADATGAILEVWTTASSGYSRAKVRRNGDTATPSDNSFCYANERSIWIVECDSAKIIECWQDTPEVRFDLIGYTTAAVHWMATQYDISTGSYQGWSAADLSTYVPSGTAGVLLRLVSEDGNKRRMSVRKKGSAYDVHEHLQVAQVSHVLVGLDSSRVFQQWREQNNMFCVLCGYVLTSEGWEFPTNMTDWSPAAGSWQDIDATAQASGTATVWVHLSNTSATAYQIATRANGSADDRLSEQYVSGTCWIGAPAALDTDDVFECYRGNSAAVPRYVGSYTAPPTWTPKTGSTACHLVGRPVLTIMGSKRAYAGGNPTITPKIARQNVYVQGQTEIIGTDRDFYGNPAPVGAYDIGIHEFQKQAGITYLREAFSAYTRARTSARVAFSAVAVGQTNIPPRILMNSSRALAVGARLVEKWVHAYSTGQEPGPFPPLTPPTGGWWSLAETLPLAKAGDRYANPRDPGAPLPYAYGDLTVGAVKGVWECPCVDTATFAYLIADHPVVPTVGNEFKVYDKDGNIIDHAQYIIDPDYTDLLGNRIAYLYFTSDREQSEPITITCKGKCDEVGLLIENPISIVEDILRSRRQAQVGDFNATALARAKSYADQRAYKAAGIIKDDGPPGEVLSQLLGGFFASWWKDNRGQIVFRFMHGPASVVENDVCDHLDEKFLSEVSIEARMDNLANTAPANYARNWAIDKWEGTDDGATTADTRSVGYYGTRRRILDLWWVRSSAVAQALQAITVDWYKEPRILMTAKDDSFRFVQIEKGDIVSYSCSTLRDEDGQRLVNQMARVMEIDLDLRAGTLQMVLLDLGTFLTQARSLHMDAADLVQLPPVGF